MNIPARLINFWYPNAFTSFFRIWHNLMNLLEEDLAVSLMLKLLFVPLFHDSSILGKILSFVFRSIRIGMGLLAFALMSVGLFFIAVIWFSLPVGIFIALFFAKWLFIVYGLVLIFGGSLFIQQLLMHRPKKVW